MQARQSKTAARTAIEAGNTSRELRKGEVMSTRLARDALWT
jgi:hypothetical protein